MQQQTDDDAPGLLGWRDALVYFGPTCVPLAMALSGRMDVHALTWLIWLELLPRGLPLAVEAAGDPKFRPMKPPVIVLFALVMLLGFMGFCAMMLTDVRIGLSILIEQLLLVGHGEGNYYSGAFEPFLDELDAMGVLPPLLVATAARTWRAWEIDWKCDPALDHLRDDMPERKSRRQLGLVMIVLWIVFLGRAVPSIGKFAPYFVAVFAAAVYCLAPDVVAWQRGPHWPVSGSRRR